MCNASDSMQRFIQHFCIKYVKSCARLRLPWQDVNLGQLTWPQGRNLPPKKKENCSYIRQAENIGSVYEGSKSFWRVWHIELLKLYKHPGRLLNYLEPIEATVSCYAFSKNFQLACFRDDTSSRVLGMISNYKESLHHPRLSTSKSFVYIQKTSCVNISLAPLQHSIKQELVYTTLLHTRARAHCMHSTGTTELASFFVSSPEIPSKSPAANCERRNSTRVAAKTKLKREGWRWAEAPRSWLLCDTNTVHDVGWSIYQDCVCGLSCPSVEEGREGGEAARLSRRRGTSKVVFENGPKNGHRLKFRRREAGQEICIWFRRIASHLSAKPCWHSLIEGVKLWQLNKVLLRQNIFYTRSIRLPAGSFY